jgi:hypothetical protein
MLSENGIIDSLKRGNFKLKTLWALLKQPNQRDGFALGIGIWDGEGEYQAVEFPNGDKYFLEKSRIQREANLPDYPTIQSKNSPYWQRVFDDQNKRF